MTYGLYNKKLDRRLTHPVVGMWFTNEFKEAENMLDACHEYLDSSGLSHMKDDFTIIDVESGKQVESTTPTLKGRGLAPSKTSPV